MKELFGKIKRKVGESFLDLAEVFVMAFSIFFVLQIAILQPHKVDGDSMVPSFIDKEFLLTDKITYRFKEPMRGDVVVFHAPEEAPCDDEEGCDYIKRIIGMPGDTVEIREGYVYVNQKKLNESYLPDSYRTLPGRFTRKGPVVLHDDEFMVMGDNRGRSSDSREWGPIPSRAIVGRTFLRYLPISKFGVIDRILYDESKPSNN